MKLPQEKTKSTRVNPKSIVLFSQPKTGKTTIVSALENCLLIDLEEGSEFVDALKIDVIKEARAQEKLPIVVLKEIINKIKEANKEKGSYVYKYIALDTVTALEDIVLPLANKMYRDTNMGRNWEGIDVTTLPNGAGYRYTRTALSIVLNELEEICDTLIILGHTKDKDIEKKGELITERSLDLTGKSSSILCAAVDTIGYVYREENETIIDFKPSVNFIIGSRSAHLKDKKLVVAVSDETGNVKVDWSKIFINK
ncbi:MAG: AAA family ATPase [Chitinophagaceae bacterium]